MPTNDLNASVCNSLMRSEQRMLLDVVKQLFPMGEIFSEVVLLLQLGSGSNEATPSLGEVVLVEAAVSGKSGRNAKENW
ncbi:hypothetical protein Pyn_08981 [Prunus yedoensis var. nudiflora]|uniref:Uncharacterized protein n=1 Tax=Prunus yedoensis var. nudiflora TaxID=2094558 RepID=A0A314XN74_PRUYE|nr:hypothetical protein Pyn_08981 [Prunus yedoensis var. nudiflora]